MSPNEALTAALSPSETGLELLRALNRIEKRITQNRLYLVALSVFSVALFVLGIGLTVSLVRTADTARRLAVTTKVSAEALCESRNESAQSQQMLWEHFIVLNANQTNSMSPVIAAQLRTILAKTFIARDCTKPLPIIDR